MKAIAFSNNDIAVAAWTFGGRITGCLGFAIYRIDVKAGTETCLPALATFPNQDATASRTTAQDPVQKFFWKDVYAKRGGSYSYRIVPMGGQPGAVTPMSVESLTTNVVQLTPDHGMLSAYFNRGILATQATAHALHAKDDLNSMKAELLQRIADPNDQLRLDLAGQMIEAMMMLPKEATSNNGKVWCALYEFEDQQLIATVTALAARANVILSNMPGTVNEKKTNDTYADERQQAAAAGVNVIDRMMTSGHIGHNKFTILDNNGPQAVQFGSTNWTGRALCAQSNNTVIARSPKIESTVPLPSSSGMLTGPLPSSLRSGAPCAPLPPAASVSALRLSQYSLLWFSPSTPKARAKKRTAQAAPPEIEEA